MFESSYPLVFWHGFSAASSTVSAGWGSDGRLPIVACVLEMSEAVPATCLVAVTLAVWHGCTAPIREVAPIIPMLLGCIPGLIIGVCVLRVVPGIWLQGGDLGGLIIYVAWQLLHRAGTAHPEACGAAPYRGSHRGSPTRRSASAGLQWRSMRSTLAGTRTPLAGRSACIFLASVSVPALFKPPPGCILRRGQGRTLGYARRVGGARLSPARRPLRPGGVFQGILLVMIAFAGSVCIIRAVESFCNGKEFY